MILVLPKIEHTKQNKQILAVLIVGLGCFIVYDKVIDNGNKSSVDKSTNPEKIEENKIDVAYARELVNKYVPAGGLSDSRRSTLLKGLTEEAKLALAKYYTTPTPIIYTCEEAFPDATLEYNSYVIRRGDFYGVCQDNINLSKYYNLYSYDSVNASYKKLFGEELSAPKTDMGNISYGISIFAFSSKYNAYIEVSCECGGLDGELIKKPYFEVKDVKTDGDKLIVDMVYIFIAKSPEDVEYTGKINDQEVKFSVSEVENEEVFLDKYLDKLDTYRLEFTYKDKAYKLVSINKV